MQTITTKYHGPTNRIGSRISATTSEGRRIYISYKCEMNSIANHMAAAKSLMESLGWEWKIIGGHTKKGMIWTLDNEFAPRG